mgnify:CR=1 FL=1
MARFRALAAAVLSLSVALVALAEDGSGDAMAKSQNLFLVSDSLMRALLFEALSHSRRSMSICPRNSLSYDQSLPSLLHSIIVRRVRKLDVGRNRGRKTERATRPRRSAPRAAVKGGIYRPALDIVPQADVVTAR